MRRILVLLAAVAGLMAISLAAQAVDLDQATCEGSLGGTWTAGTSTCDAPFILGAPDPLVIPAGVTLTSDFADILSSAITNYGTIVITDVWHNHGGLDNYGSFTTDSLDHDDVVNHCGSTFNVNFDNSSSVTNLDCSVLASITADPTSGTEPLTVDWTITLENDGDEDLDSVAVELSTDGGATAFTTLSAPPDSGDDGDSVLEVGETWEWVVQTTESGDVTVTATGAGTAPSGLVVTFPGDTEARAATAVTVTPAATTTTSTSTTSTSTTSTTLGTTTSSTPTDVGGASATLPLTDRAENWDFGTIAIALMAIGGLTVLLFTRDPEEE